jgi:hypothetical protein
MRRRIFVAAVVAALVMLPAASAFAADQDVDVQVMPADTLAISVEEGVGFPIEVGATQTQMFDMEITNTTDTGWVVSVDGADLQGYVWESCDEDECHDRVLTGHTIDKSNLVLRGGDMSWSEASPADDPFITAFSAPLGVDPVTIMTGTADATGMMGFYGDDQKPMISVTVPLGTPIDQYFTVLTYTITAP